MKDEYREILEQQYAASKAELPEVRKKTIIIQEITKKNAR